MQVIETEISVTEHLGVLSVLFESGLSEETNVDNAKILKEILSNEWRFVHYESQELEKFIQDKENKSTLRKKHCMMSIYSVPSSVPKIKMREIYKNSPTKLDVFLANFILSVRKKGV